MEDENRTLKAASFHHLLEPETGASAGLRIGLVAAVGIHLAVFAITWPKFIEPLTDEPGRLTVRRFQVVKFIPPPPPDRQYSLPPRRVPVPDPDPLGPEPIREDMPRISVEPIPEDLVAFVPEPPPLPAPSLPPSTAVAGIDVEPPVAVHRVEPIYTETAKKVHIQGAVILSLVIDTDGEVAEVTVLRGLPFGLTESAVDAARQWRFQPSTIDGTPVNVRFTLTVRFSLSQ